MNITHTHIYIYHMSYNIHSYIIYLNAFVCTFLYASCTAFLEGMQYHTNKRKTAKPAGNLPELVGVCQSQPQRSRSSWWSNSPLSKMTPQLALYLEPQTPQISRCCGTASFRSGTTWFFQMHKGVLCNLIPWSQNQVVFISNICLQEWLTRW